MVKYKVRFVLNYYTMEPKAPESQEQAIEKHIDNMNSHDTSHEKLDNIANLLDPTQTINTVNNMPNETGEQKYKLITALRKNIRQSHSLIAENKPDADAYMAAKKHDISNKTIELAGQAEGSIDLVTQKNTIPEINEENKTLDAKKKINNKKKAMITKEEKKALNVVPQKRSSSSNNEIKVKKQKGIPINSTQGKLTQ